MVILPSSRPAGSGQSPPDGHDPGFDPLHAVVLLLPGDEPGGRGLAPGGHDVGRHRIGHQGSLRVGIGTETKGRFIYISLHFSYYLSFVHERADVGKCSAAFQFKLITY